MFRLRTGQGAFEVKICSVSGPLLLTTLIPLSLCPYHLNGPGRQHHPQTASDLHARKGCATHAPQRLHSVMASRASSPRHNLHPRPSSKLPIVSKAASTTTLSIPHSIPLFSIIFTVRKCYYKLGGKGLVTTERQGLKNGGNPRDIAYRSDIGAHHRCNTGRNWPCVTPVTLITAIPLGWPCWRMSL